MLLNGEMLLDVHDLNYWKVCESTSKLLYYGFLCRQIDCHTYIYPLYFELNQLSNGVTDIFGSIINNECTTTCPEDCLYPWSVYDEYTSTYDMDEQLNVTCGKYT